MPVLSAGVKAGLRTSYLRAIHNSTCNVKKRIGETTANANPIFESSKTQTYREYTGFKCSYYHALSGKMNRLFDERGNPELSALLGTLSGDTYVVSYVCDLTLTAGADGYAYSPIPNNLAVDEEILIKGVWYKVRVVVPDSEGIQHTVFVTQ